jgi:hypothetical protein
MHEVGCPEPAAVVAIIEQMLSRRAFSRMASIVEAPACVDALMPSPFSCPALIPAPAGYGPDSTGFRSFALRPLEAAAHLLGEPPFVVTPVALYHGRQSLMASRLF